MTAVGAPPGLPARAPHGLDAAVVRVQSPRGGVVGSGFLVGVRHVLTCAHVVSDALGSPLHRPPAPEDVVLLDFALVAPGQLLEARVVGWHPVQDDERGDVAVLELLAGPPPAAVPARLTHSTDLWDHPFRAFGFPKGLDDGVWASGRLRGRQGTGWVQMEGVPSAYTVQRGFSGGAVWDDDLAAVVGMVVAADTRSGANAAYLLPTDTLAETWPELSASTLPPCPYRGLSPFRSQDAGLFHGRRELTALLAREVRRRSVVAVVGPSGSGKSSVVFAGLVPELSRTGGWAFVTMRPSRASSPTAALAVALLELLEPDVGATARAAAVETLVGLLVEGRLLDITDQVLRQTAREHLLIVVDQFEELFNREQDQVTDFASVLQGAIGAEGAERGDALSVALTLRADFLGRALEDPLLTTVLHDAVTTVGQMTREQLRQAIDDPLPDGVHYEEGLVSRILADVGTNTGSLPLLEFALTLLWERQESGVLTHQAYELLGGVDGALARYAEQIFTEALPPEDQVEARRLLIQLVRPTDVGVPVRRVARREDLSAQRWSLGQRLAGTRLLVTNSDPLGESVELVHEALIGGWSRLHTWVEQDLAFRTWQEQLRSSAAAWKRTHQDEGALLRGAPLEEAERWLEERPEDLSDADRDFVLASRTLRRRAGVRRTAVLATVGVLVLVLVAGGSLFWQTWSGQGREEQARVLLEQARLRQDTRPDIALLLAAAAHEKHASSDTRQELTLQSSAWRHVERLLVPPVDGLVDLAYTDEPDVLALAAQRQVTLWNTRTGKTVGDPHPVPGRLADLASTSDGRDLALLAQQADGSLVLSLWSPGHSERNERLPQPLEVREGVLPEVRLSRSGGAVGLCTKAGIQVWTTAPLRRQAVVPMSPTEDQSGCSFDVLDDGRVLQAAGRQLRLWTTTQPQAAVVRTFTGPPSDGLIEPDPGLSVVGVTPDGVLALVSDESAGGLALVDLRNGERLTAPELDDLSVNSRPDVHFSADSRWVVLASGATALRLDLAKPRVASAQPMGTGDGVDPPSRGLAVSPDSRTTMALASPEVLAVVRSDAAAPVPSGEVGFTPLADPGTYLVMDGDLAVVRYGADGSRQELVPAASRPPGDPRWPLHGLGEVSDDGRWFARRGTAPDEVVLGRLPRGEVVSRDRLSGPVTSLTFSPGGQFLAAAARRELVLWSVPEGRVVARTASAGPSTYVGAVSPSGNSILTSDGNGDSSRSWEVSPPELTEGADIPLGDVSTGSFSPDGAWLAVSIGGEVRLWDVSAGRLLDQRFPDSSPYTRARFGPRGLLVTSTEDEAAVTVWHVPDGRLVGGAAVPPSDRFEFLSSGDLVFAGDSSGRIPFRPGEALRLACDLVGGTKTPADVERHVGDLDYDDPCD